ncbi:molybdenum cofactor guanylyltransferase MobA [Niveispirillum fermenti]|uniref:molybdenum cofactor guanylyltransferase MobA n=1 Tax=Niveispirillum fermenti TaxID=1233113 RepID=UPI003A886B8E
MEDERGRPPLGVILAGGLATRMGGGDKGLVMLDGRPLMQHAMAALHPWADRILISANGPAARFAGLEWMGDAPVLPDTVPDRPGPLAGILAAMEWAAAHAPDHADILCVPCDTPFLPADLLPRLAAGRQAAGAAIALAAGPDGAGGWQRHPTVGLWPVALRRALRNALVVEGLRKVGAFAARHGVTLVRFPPGPGGRDPFLNVNSPGDLTGAVGSASTPAGEAHS